MALGWIAEPGTVLGLFEDLTYQTMEWQVEPGDSIILFTDGIVEVEDSRGEEFGVTRMRATLGETLHGSTAQGLERVIAAALRHSANQQFTDDVCLLGIDFYDYSTGQSR